VLPAEATPESVGDAPALLFDMDGVVLEGSGIDPEVHDRALGDALEAAGIDPPPRQRAALAGYAYDDEFVAACEALGVDPPSLFEARERFSARRAIARVRGGRRRLHDDVGVVDDLVDRWTLGLVSNNYEATVSAVVDYFGLDAFSVAVGREPGLEGYRRRKPDPHYLEATLETLGASDGIYVGDRPTDVTAARRAGLEPAFVRRDHNRDVEVAPGVLELAGLRELRRRG